jgi:hypothetical protein
MRPMINITAYLTDEIGQDWNRLLKDWSKLLPQGAAVWMVNRIGDVIVVAPDGSVHLLDVGTEHVSRIAASRDDFLKKVEEGTNAKQWLATPLIDECVAAGMTLAPGQCYGFKVAPLLGGDYVLENMVPTGLAEHYAAMAKAAGR